MTIQVYYLFSIEDSSRNPSWERGKKVTHILHSGVYPSSTNSQLPSPKLTANAPENGWLELWGFPVFSGAKNCQFLAIRNWWVTPSPAGSKIQCSDCDANRDLKSFGLRLSLRKDAGCLLNFVLNRSQDKNFFPEVM